MRRLFRQKLFLNLGRFLSEPKGAFQYTQEKEKDKMPKVNLPKKVVQSEKPKAILDLFFERLKESKIGNRFGELHSPEEIHLDEIAPSDERLREGWWVSILFKIENLTGITFESTKEVPIPYSSPLRLSREAYLLYKAYLKFLNNTLKKEFKCNLDAVCKKTESEIIDSPYVLVYELLRRLAAAALSENMDPDRDGEQIILLMQDFVSKLAEMDILNENHSKPCYFSRALATLNPEWLCALRDMVQSIQLMNKNYKTINGLDDFLYKSKCTLTRRLISELDSKKQIESVSDNWIEMTLENCEKAYVKSQYLSTQLIPLRPLNESFFSKSQQTYLIKLESSFDSCARTQQSHLIIQALSEDPGKEETLYKVQALYNLLVEANLLTNLMFALKNLFKSTGWLPILMGVLNFDALSQSIIKFGEKCKEALYIHVDDPRFNTPMGKALIRYQAASGIDLSLEAGYVSADLTLLQDPSMLRALALEMESNLSHLLDLQRNLDLFLVDESAIQSMRDYCISYNNPEAALEASNNALLENNLETSIEIISSTLKKHVMFFKENGEQELSALHQRVRAYCTILYREGNRDDHLEEKLLRDLERILEIDQKDISALRLIVFRLLLREDYDKAKTLVENSLNSFPENEEIKDILTFVMDRKDQDHQYFIKFQ